MDWRQILANRSWGLELGDKALQIDKDQRRHRVVEHSIENAYLATEGKPLSEWPEELGEDMSVNIGDTYNSQPAATSGLPTIARLLATAVIGAAVAGPAGFLAASYLTSPEPTTAPAASDADTQYEFQLGFPK